MISISIDEGDTERSKVVKFQKEFKPGFPIVHDPEEVAVKAFDLSGGIPANIVIDRSGRIVGYASELADLQKLVAKVVPAHAAQRRRAAR